MQKLFLIVANLNFLSSGSERHIPPSATKIILEYLSMAGQGFSSSCDFSGNHTVRLGAGYSGLLPLVIPLLEAAKAGQVDPAAACGACAAWDNEL